MQEIKIPILDYVTIYQQFSKTGILDYDAITGVTDKYNEVDICDIWGAYQLDEKYKSIIHSKEFIDQDDKLQLGACHFHNANHTRRAHALGVFALGYKLVNIIKGKFGNIINVSDEDEAAIMIFGLVHDIGHHGDSHSAETFLEGNHEERAIAILLDENTEIHRNIVKHFGINVLMKVIGLINPSKYQNNDFLTMIRPLLSGGVDIDRIDYIHRDAKFVLGDAYKEGYSNLDFSDLLEYIDITNIDGKQRIVFEEESEERLREFYEKKFELHDVIYYGAPTSILEEMYRKCAVQFNLGITWNDGKAKLNRMFKELINSSNPILSKWAWMIERRDLNGRFLIKEVDNERTFNEIMELILNEIPELNQVNGGQNYCLHTTRRTVKMYNSKYPTLIKRKDGTVYDLSQTINFDASLRREKYVVGVDISLLNTLLDIRDNGIRDRINGIFNLGQVPHIAHEYKDPFLRSQIRRCE